MATSRTFNLTAELNLRGPTNIGPIISNLKNQLSNISANVTVNVAPNATTNVATLNSRLTALNATLVTTRTNTQAAAAAIQAFATAVNNINVGNVPQQITAVNNAINTLGNNNVQAARQIRQTGTEMEEFGRQAGLAIRRFAAFSVVGAGVMTFSRSLDQGVKAFIEYDKQLVKLQQVTGQTAVGLRGLTREITELSTGLGVSSSELTEVASTLAQAGLSARDTEKALKALALSSLAPSFDNMNETVEGSIALMRQFDISAGDLEKALSSINEVSAKFAVEASDIVTAIQRTGGVFATASKGVATGTEALNQFIAVFTSVRATTRESAETIATGLRTIFSRVQRGDTIEALKEYGVNLTDLDGKFVGAYRAVELLSQGLSRIDPRELRFSQITEELGGFRQIGKVIPLIQQFAVAQEALRTAEKGQGSLARDATTAQLSLANQIAKVREQFLSLFREIGGSNTFQTITRGALSLAGAMIRIADSMKEVLPVLGIMFAFRGASAVSQFGSGFLGAVRGNQRRANGGYIQAYAGGGTVNAMLMPGEAVIEPNVAARIGKNKLDKLNHAEKYAGGGGVKFVPGSGSTDSFGPIPLEVGSYVLRKNAVNAMGRERVSGLAKYAGGGPVDIADIAKKTESKSRQSNLRNLYDVDNKLNNKIYNDQATFGTIKSVSSEESIGKYKKYRERAQNIWKRANNFFLKEEKAYKGEQPASENVEKEWASAATKRIRRMAGDTRTEFIQALSVSELRGALTKDGKPDGRVLNKISGGLGEIDFNKKIKGLEKKANKDGIDFVQGNNLYEVKVREKKLSDEEMYAKTLLLEGNNSSKKYRNNEENDSINLTRYNLWKVEAQKTQKYAKGGPVFGSGDFKFPKRISNAYFKELEKKENSIAWDKAVLDSPKEERLMVDAANIQEPFQKPLDREAFKQTFKSAISRKDIFHNMANFAKVIGLPKENLETILPQFVDFKADSVKGSFFSSSAKGSRGNEGISLEPHGYSEKDAQDLYGYEAILKEKAKTLAKIRTTPTKEYDDGSFDFDNVAYKKEWEETDSIKGKIFDLNRLHADADSAAEVSRYNFAKATGRGSISIDTSSRFNKPKNEVLYHELTHQLMNSLKTKNSDVLSIYNRRVESLFGGDNDDLMDAFDALPETGNYKSADIVYGRSYKTRLLNQIINSKAKGDPSISDYVIEHGPTTSMKSSAANRARDFAPLNPEMNKLLKMGNVTDETLKRTEDVGKEEFITTLMQNLPHLNSGLQGALDSTLSEILGAAGITRQQYAEGGVVKDSNLLLSALQSHPFTYSPTSTISKLLKSDGAENSLKAIQSSYRVQSAKIVGSGAENVIFDIGKQILKISQGGNYNLPKGVSGIAGYGKIKQFGQLTAALQEKLNTEKIGTSKDVSLLQNKIGKKGLNWSDAHELNIGYDQKGRPKILDGSIISKYAEGGMVQRRLGILDSDVIKNPANEKVVMEAMAAMGMTDKTKYKHALSAMAAQSRLAKNLGSYKVLAGVAGTGKSSLATSRGQETTVGTLRSTTRFPILTPEDLKKATDVIDITATASPQKIESFIQYADKALLLSTSTPEEQALAKKRRGIRDLTGVGLYGRKAGASKGATLDSAELEIAMASLGPKLKVLSAASMKRKRGSQLISVKDTLMDLYFGSFSPMQKGHEARARMAQTEGVGGLPYVMVGPNESIKRRDIGDSHAARTLVLPQDFRTQIARAALGGEGFSVMPKSNSDFGIPSLFELEPGEEGQRRFVRPSKGSMAHTQGKNVTSSGGMYGAAGFGLKNIEDRIGGFSGTDTREAILSGNMTSVEQSLSVAVFDIIKRNLIALQNRANIAPRILENYGTSIDAIVEEVNRELKPLPRLTDKNKAKDPTLEARVLELRKRKKRALTGSGITSPHTTMARLARRYPEYYGLETGSEAKPLVNQIDESDKSSWQSEFFSRTLAKSKLATEKVTAADVTTRDISGFVGMKIPREIYDMDPLAWNKDLAKRGIAVPFEEAKISLPLIRLLSRRNLAGQNMGANKLAAMTALQDLIYSQMTMSETKTGRAEEMPDMAAEMEKYQQINKDSSVKKVAVVGIDPFDEAKVEGPMLFGKTKVAMFVRGLPSKFKPSINKLRKNYDSIVKTTSEEFIDIRGKGDKKKLRTLSEKEKMATGKAGSEGGLLEFLLSTLGARGGTVQSRGIDFPFGLGAAAWAFPGIDPNWPTEAKRTLSSDNLADAREKYKKFFSEKVSTDAKKTKKIKKMAFGGEVPIMAQEGEYVINRASAQQIGYSNLDRLNKYHTGGMVSTRKFASGGTVSEDPGVQQGAMALIGNSQINNLRLWSGLFNDLSNRFRASNIMVSNASTVLGNFSTRTQQLQQASATTQIPLARLIQAMGRDLNDAIASGTMSIDDRVNAERALIDLMDLEATALQQLSGQRQAQTRQLTGNVSQRINQTPYLGAGVRGLSRMGSAVNGQAGYFLGMGVSMIGTQAENMFGKRDTNAATAGRVAQVEGITGTAGAGLSLAGGLAGIPGIGPFAAGVAVAGTAVYSLTDYLTDFTGTVKNATNEFEAGVRAKDIAKATTDVEKAMEALQKDFNNPVLREEVNKTSKARTELATADFRKNVTTVSERMNPKGFFRGITGQEAAPLTEEKINKIAQEISTSDASRQNESMARQTIETKIQQGMSLNNISDGGEWLKLTEQILQTDAGFVELVQSGNQAAISNRITAKAVELLEDPALRAAEKAKQLSDAMDAADKAGRRLAFSLERVADSITQSMDAAMFNFEKSLSERSGITDSLSGKASIREVKSESINILKNPKAYSEQEFGGALQEAVNLNSSIGGDPRVSSMITGSAGLGRSLSDRTQKAVRVAAGGNASLSLGDAKSIALKEGTAEIQSQGKSLGLSKTAQEDLVVQLKGRLDKAGEAAKKDDKGNIDVNAFDEELKQLGDSIGQRGKEIAISILEFKDNAINKFIGAMNEGTKHLIEADRYRAKATEIGVKGGFDMRQVTTGVAPSFDELSSVRNAKIAQLTGGLTDPTAISNSKSRMAAGKELLQAGVEQAAKNNPAAAGQLAEQIKQMDASINQADEALKELANNTDLAAAALDEMKTVIELQKQTIDSTKKVLSTGPKELKQQFDAMARVRFMMAGGTVNNTKQAQRAFTDTLRSTGDRRQAEIARQDVLAQQRGEEQQAFERMKPMAQLKMANMGMTPDQIDQQIKRAEANMMTAQGRAAGINTSNESNMIVDPANASAAGIAAQQKFAAANGVQMQANMELSKEEKMMAGLSDATQQLTKAFVEAADRMRRAFGIDQQVENPLNMPAVAAPVAPKNIAKGGVVYASRGTLVNYEPQGTDTVPAMLTPGEFVVNARATSQHLPLLQALNRSSGGEIPSGAVFGKFVTTNIRSSKSKIDPRGRSSYMSNGGVVYLQRGGRSYRNRGNEPYVGIAGQQEFMQAYQSQIPRYDPERLAPRLSIEELVGSRSTPPQEGGIFAHARRQNEKFLREKELAEKQKMEEAANASFPLLPFINNRQAASGLLGLSNTLSQIPSAIPSLIGPSPMGFSGKNQQPAAPGAVSPEEAAKAQRHQDFMDAAISGASGETRDEKTRRLASEAVAGKPKDNSFINSKYFAARALGYTAGLGEMVGRTIRGGVGVAASAIATAGAPLVYEAFGEAQSKAKEAELNKKIIEARKKAGMENLDNLNNSTSATEAYMGVVAGTAKAGAKDLLFSIPNALTAGAIDKDSYMNDSAMTAEAKKQAKNLRESGQTGLAMATDIANTVGAAASHLAAPGKKFGRIPLPAGVLGKIGSKIGNKAGKFVYGDDLVAATSDLRKIPGAIGNKIKGTETFKIMAEDLAPISNRIKGIPQNLAKAGSSILDKIDDYRFGPKGSGGSKPQISYPTGYEKFNRNFEKAFAPSQSALPGKFDPTKFNASKAAYVAKTEAKAAQAAKTQAAEAEKAVDAIMAQKGIVDPMKMQADIFAAKTAKPSITSAPAKAAVTQQQAQATSQASTSVVAPKPTSAAKTLSEQAQSTRESLIKKGLARDTANALSDIELSILRSKLVGITRQGGQREKAIKEFIESARPAQPASAPAKAAAVTQQQAQVAVATPTKVAPTVKTPSTPTTAPAKTAAVKQQQAQVDAPTPLSKLTFEEKRLQDLRQSYDAFESRIAELKSQQRRGIFGIRKKVDKTKEIAEIREQQFHLRQKIGMEENIIIGTKQLPIERKGLGASFFEGDEWKRLLEGGIPNEYRTYGTFKPNLSEEGKAFSRLRAAKMRSKGMDPGEKPQAANYSGFEGAMFDKKTGKKLLVPENYRVKLNKISSQAGYDTSYTLDPQGGISILGKDGTGRPGAKLYNIPSDEVTKELLEKIQKLNIQRLAKGGVVKHLSHGGFVSSSPRYLATGGIVSPSRYSGGGGVRASAAMINNGVSSNRSVNMSEQLDPIYKALGGLLENHAAAFGGQVGNLNGAADKFQQAFGMVSGGIAVNHNLTAQHNHSGHLNTLQQNIEDKTAGLVSNVIGTMRRSSDGGLDQMLGMDSNQIIGKSKYT